MIRVMLLTVLCWGLMGDYVAAKMQFNVICGACTYEESVSEGATKYEFYNYGTGSGAFFCRQSKTFVSLLVILEQALYDKSKKKVSRDKLAVPTKMPVRKGAGHMIHTHSSCPNGLIPLDWFRMHPSPCPVCGKGRVEIKWQSSSS